MNYQTSDVYNYLNYLEKYLIGDLQSFRKICKDAEIEESCSKLAITSSYIDNNQILEQISTSTTTIQTTIYPTNIKENHSLQVGNNEAIFRLTIPITLTLFASVDYLGYLSGSNDKALDTYKNFYEFFKKSTTEVTKSEIDILNQIFRQGLTHVYFPKLGLGISYHSNNLSRKLFFRDINGTLILNVNKLEEIVIDTFNNIKQNASLYTLMETRYHNLQTEYQLKYKSMITSFKD